MKKIVAFIFSVIFASSLFAETFDSVCENLSKHPVMTGRFSQVKTISSVNRQMKSNGTFIFSLDGIMWKTEKPFASSMVVGMTSVVQTLANGKQTVIDASSNPIARISSSVNGIGSVPEPTNPVTPLVFLTMYHVSSVTIIFIRT